MLRRVVPNFNKFDKQYLWESFDNLFPNFPRRVSTFQCKTLKIQQTKVDI